MAISKAQSAFCAAISSASSPFCPPFCLFTGVTPVPLDYLEKKANLIQSEQNLRTGGNGSCFSPLEKLVNDIMVKEKRTLIEASRLHRADFPVSHSFLNLTAKAAMEATKAYQIIRMMPKGGALHVHDLALTSIDWLVKNATYRKHCYMRVTSSYDVRFYFFDTLPSNSEYEWRLVSDYRKESGNATAFDQSLYDNMTLITQDPERAYPDINAVWKRFDNYFDTVMGLLFYAPVFEDYLWQGLKEFYEDNVQYLEMYDLNGIERNNDWVIAMYRRVVNEFVRLHPDFTGARVIKVGLKIVHVKETFPNKTMGHNRFLSADTVREDIKEAMRLYAKNSDFMVGYDLVAQEDPYNPLIYYIDELLMPSRQNPPVNLPYFFHAGETNWQETATDYNLMDAVLLNTTRLGHAYALYKHPVVMDIVKNRDIAVEVNPISNQVLKLVEDPRNHPAASLIASNVPLVISSDDPATWGATPLSHDFYVTFMALIGEESGLATLKHLAMNSLRYSAMTQEQKDEALSNWEAKWNSFIEEVVKSGLANNVST